MDLVKRRNDQCFLLKVDFEKAYDSVNWDFMNYMLERMGFSLVWRKWIRICICSNSVSILVNGSPTEDFNVGKGLRQGDPLAPFLFLIVAEGLARLVQKAVSIGKLKGVHG